MPDTLEKEPQLTWTSTIAPPDGSTGIMESTLGEMSLVETHNQDPAAAISDFVSVEGSGESPHPERLAATDTNSTVPENSDAAVVPTRRSSSLGRRGAVIAGGLITFAGALTAATVDADPAEAQTDGQITITVDGVTCVAPSGDNASASELIPDFKDTIRNATGGDSPSTDTVRALIAQDPDSARQGRQFDFRVSCSSGGSGSAAPQPQNNTPPPRSDSGGGNHALNLRQYGDGGGSAGGSSGQPRQQSPAPPRPQPQSRPQTGRVDTSFNESTGVMRFYFPDLDATCATILGFGSADNLEATFNALDLRDALERTTGISGRASHDEYKVMQGALIGAVPGRFVSPECVSGNTRVHTQDEIDRVQNPGLLSRGLRTAAEISRAITRDVTVAAADHVAEAAHGCLGGDSEEECGYFRGNNRSTSSGRARNCKPMELACYGDG